MNCASFGRDLIKSSSNLVHLDVTKCLTALLELTYCLFVTSYLILKVGPDTLNKLELFNVKFR